MRKKYHLPTGAVYAPYLIDIVENNHTLIAGSTGAGKSVLENSIIYALLSTTFPGKPDHGRGAHFVLIDPKKVELFMYKNLPHTLLYADNIPDIINALQIVRDIINQRLSKMQRAGLRKSDECEIYVFIDELVDLVKSKESKTIINLLADSISIARAANVFFCISTQAPNRRILLPEIVLNCNCRVALFCNDRIESREIIGDGSAADLPKHGIAIVKRNIDRYKIKIPFYSDAEIDKMIAHWEKQNKLSGIISRIKNKLKRH